MSSISTSRNARRLALMGLSVAALAACQPGGQFDGDFRGFGKGGFSTRDAALSATGARPAPDARGIISYPGYQVAIARQGDTVDSVAARIGMAPADLASYNALAPGAPLHAGEVLTLPRRVGDAPLAPAATIGAAPAIGTLPQRAPGAINVTTIAGSAIDRASPPATPVASAAPKPAAPSGPQPAQHRVERGETAYSIARLYNVNVKALADWNGLGSDLAVREGQVLLIPVGAGKPANDPVDTSSLPGEGSTTPPPPSASKPKPAEKPVAAAAPVDTPPAPDLGTTASTKFGMPVSGKIIRGYQKGKNDGIDISAGAGSTVAAAGSGTVAAITKDTKGVPILVLRHDGNLLTVYANIDAPSVKKGDKVKRGQAIAKVRASDPAFLHFEVRQGFDSVDPTRYLQ